MTKELLATGKHTVTAITRADSKSTLPDGIKVVTVDYDKPATLVEALKGQDALVITLSVFAHGQQDKLIDAAAEAGVPWVLPNEWSPDTAHEGLAKEVIGFGESGKTQQKIKHLGKSSFIAVTCGFWYEWSLSIPAAFGIDSIKQEAILFDEGDVKMSISTWPQVGRAVAALLSLPIKAEGGDEHRCLEHFRNHHIYIASFTVSQKDMLDSALRVTGSKIEDWKITKEPSADRYKEGMESMQKGDRMGFVKQMYTRVFFPDDSGNYEKRRGLSNELLGLPKEDIDEATKAAIERQKNAPAW